MKTKPLYSGSRKGGVKNPPSTPKPNIKPKSQVHNQLELDFLQKCWEDDCSFTGTTGTITHMSLETMAKLLDELPKPAIKVVKVMSSNLLPDGTICISHDLAEAIEAAMGE